jgi:hypothetical protein
MAVLAMRARANSAGGGSSGVFMELKARCIQAILIDEYECRLIAIKTQRSLY